MTQLVLPASVSESDIGSIKTGDAVSVVFAALTSTSSPNGTTVRGTVSAVALTSTVTSGVVSYGITITLTSPPANLRLGQSGNATITTASASNVLVLPSSAITALGARKTVQVVNGNTTSLVVVTTGLSGNGETEISSGLSAGQTVVIPTTNTTPTATLIGGTGQGGVLGGGR